MTTFLEYLPTDTQHETVDIGEVEKLSETIQEVAYAVQRDPRCEEKIEALKQHCVDAAHILLSTPEVAPEIVPPLGEAAQTLYSADNVDAEVDFRVTETLGNIAAGIPYNFAERKIFVKIAIIKATDFFRQQHAANNEIGKELDKKLLDAFTRAIDTAAYNNLSFREAFKQAVNDAFAEVEAKYIDQSSIGEYHRDQLLLKSNRLANYARGNRDVETEMTGTIIQNDNTGPIEVVTTMPSIDDKEAYSTWKKRLASTVTSSLALQAMKDDEYERIATAEEIVTIRSQLDASYSAAS